MSKKTEVCFFKVVGRSSTWTFHRTILWLTNASDMASYRASFWYTKTNKVPPHK
jgi:hypothetical protein